MTQMDKSVCCQLVVASLKDHLVVSVPDRVKCRTPCKIDPHRRAPPLARAHCLGQREEARRVPVLTRSGRLEAFVVL